jgi:hypothetical protein
MDKVMGHTGVLGLLGFNFLQDCGRSFQLSESFVASVGCGDQ